MNIAEARSIVGKVQFRDWRFIIDETNYAERFLVIEFDAPCNVTGQPSVQRSRKWRLSRHMTRSELVQTCWLAVQTALEHEARKEFTWSGRAIFGPHFDVERLWELCGSAGASDVRPPH